MRILKQWRETEIQCYICDAKLAYTHWDVIKEYNKDKGDRLYVKCPVCKHNIYLNESK